jgi:DNA repair exonuclease SbcCD nuclease subunit
VRFLHTADWQIGMRAAHAGAAAARVREERLAAGRRVVELAKERGAEFLVVAGDVFEDNAVERVLVQRTGDVLADFPGPVFLLPGNHDPFAPGSVWEHPVWSSHGNLRVLSEPEPVEVPGGALWPCPLFERRGGADPTAWVPPEGGEGIRIGVAHGSLEGIVVDDFPIPRDAAERRGLDYLALGHWHSFGTVADSAGAPRTAYAGTHETTKFGERDSGTCILVTVEGRGAAPEVERLESGGLAWIALDREIEAPDGLAALREEVEALADPDRTLLRVRISGLLFAEEEPELERLREVVASRFLHGRTEDEALRPAPEDESWVVDLPPGPVREAAGRLRALADGTEAGAAADALLLLYRLAREVGS